VVQPPQGERAPDLSAWLVWTVGKQPQRKHSSIMRITIRQLRNLLKGLIIMATLEDQVIALTGAVATLQTNMSAIGTQVADIAAKVSALATPAPATVDLSPVLAAIADVKAQLEPTPAAPASPVGPNT
jgi:hypothetical protein